MKEFQIYLLDPRYRLATKGKPIAETDDLGTAVTIIYDIYRLSGREVAVWQPRTGHFRDYYKNPTKIQTFGRIK